MLPFSIIITSRPHQSTQTPFRGDCRARGPSRCLASCKTCPQASEQPVSYCRCKSLGGSATNSIIAAHHAHPCSLSRTRDTIARAHRVNTYDICVCWDTTQPLADVLRCRTLAHDTSPVALPSWKTSVVRCVRASWWLWRKVCVGSRVGGASE